MKKRKRKLKKSVKRGCSVILLGLLLLLCLPLVRCIRHAVQEEQEEDVIVPLPPDSLDLAVADRLQALVESPQRIDTSQLAISVFDLQRHCTVYQYRSGEWMPPASCMKLLTAVSALHYLGTDHQYCSLVSTRGSLSQGKLKGTLVVSLDDDPHIDTFDAFADSLLHLGIQDIEGNIAFHLARTDTLRPHPTASRWDISYNRLPILLKGEKRVTSEFLACLRQHGITYQPDSTLADGEDLGLHFQLTRPLCEVLAPMLIYSSNIKAEAIFRHTGQAVGSPNASLKFVHEEMPDETIDGMVVNDGSGLSPQNRLTADFLVHLLTYAYHREDIFQEFTTHALASPNDALRSGSLTGRMTAPRFTGKVHAKTGTLTTIGASSLSGYCQAPDGRWYAFSILNNDTPVAESRIFQDRICDILVRME